MGLRGALGHTDESGDLFMAVSLDVVKDENSPGSWREGGNRSLQIDTHRWLARRHGEVQLLGNGQDVGAVFPPPSGAKIAEDDVDGESMEPSAEGALTSEGFELAPRPNKGLLGQILGSIGIGHHPKAKAVHLPQVGPIKLLESGKTPFLGSLDELLLVVGLPTHGGDCQPRITGLNKRVR